MCPVLTLGAGQPSQKDPSSTVREMRAAQTPDAGDKNAREDAPTGSRPRLSPAGPLPGGGGETRGGVSGRRPFVVHQAEVGQGASGAALPVRADEAEVGCVVCRVLGSASEGESAREKAHTRVWWRKSSGAQSLEGEEEEKAWNLKATSLLFPRGALPQGTPLLR